MTETELNAARARKAVRIARAAQRAGISAKAIATSDEARAKAHSVANTLPPSLETWQLVVALLEALEEEAAVCP